MIEYNAVGLLYTYKCTGTCEICGLKCGPNRNEKMDLEVAKKVIRDSAYNGIKLIGITGGEPFILNSRLKIIHCSQSFDFSNFLQNSV